MADAKKYWIGPGVLRVEKRLMVQQGEELTKQILAKCGGKEDKDGSKWVTAQMAAGMVGEKISAVSAAGRPSKEVVALRNLVEAKDKVIEDLTADVEKLKAEIEDLTAAATSKAEGKDGGKK